MPGSKAAKARIVNIAVGEMLTCNPGYANLFLKLEARKPGATGHFGS